MTFDHVVFFGNMVSFSGAFSFGTASASIINHPILQSSSFTISFPIVLVDVFFFFFFIQLFVYQGIESVGLRPERSSDYSLLRA